MPRSYTSNDDQREKRILHAPWWSPKMTTDGQPNSPEVDEGGVYVERCVVFARYLAVDEDAVQRRIFGTMDAPKPGQKLDMSMTTKAPMYTVQQMVTELTDDQGNPAPMTHLVGKRPMLTEVYIRGMDYCDRDFILTEINKLKEAPVPVTEQDEAEAERRNVTIRQKNAELQSKVERGWPAERAAQEYQEEVSPADIAAETFFQHR